jgi:hypothetical protein
MLLLLLLLLLLPPPVLLSLPLLLLLPMLLVPLLTLSANRESCLLYRMSHTALCSELNSMGKLGCPAKIAADLVPLPAGAQRRKWLH